MDYRRGVLLFHVGGAGAAGGATSTHKRRGPHLDVDVRAISSRRCRSSSANKT
jgi:hypothetical protein